MWLSSSAKDGVEVLLLSNVLYYPFRSNNCLHTESLWAIGKATAPQLLFLLDLFMVFRAQHGVKLKICSMQQVARRLCMATRATRVLKQQYCIFKSVEKSVEGVNFDENSEDMPSNIHWTTLSLGVSLVEVEINQRGHGTFSSGYRLNKLGQVVSPQNNGKHLASIKLDKAKAAKLCVSNLFFSCWLRFWNCWWWSDLQKSKHRPRTRRPLLSTATTVGDCSILNWATEHIPHMCKQLQQGKFFHNETFKTWTKELAPWRQHFSKGSCCFPPQLRMSSQVAIMAIETAIVAMAMHTFTRSINQISSTRPCNSQNQFRAH